MDNFSPILIPEKTNQIKIENYVIGYSKEGESIVVLFKYDDIVFYSIIIDSYEININKAEEILNKNKIKKINVLIWTHPHSDHSIGIEKILDNFCNKDTKIVIPNIDQSLKKDIPINCQEIYDKFTTVNLNNKKSQGSLIYGMYNLPIYKSFINWRGEQLTFNIYCTSPVTKFLANNKFTTSTNINDYSLSILIEFNNVMFIYGGDIENKTINYLVNEGLLFDNIVFLKAPHHGSNSTNSIFKLVNILEDTICAVTNYNNGDISLPNEEMVEEYSKKTNELYLFNKNHKELNFGILKSEFIMVDSKNIIFSNNVYGRAYHY